MEETVAKWVLEFFIRKPSIDKILNGVLECLPLSDNNRLEKTLLLRRIEAEISTGSFSEKLLEFLETIAELDHGEGKMVSDSIKESYCAVAVDCTARFLNKNVQENGEYFRAVERVWRNRVSMKKALVSEEASCWWKDIEAAVLNSSVREMILLGNTRNEALKSVRSYLEEGWKSLGPTVLELVASKFGDKGEELRPGDGGGGDGVISDNLLFLEIGSNQGIQKGQDIIRKKPVAVKSKHPRGAKLYDIDEEPEGSMNTANDVSIHKTEKVQEKTNVASGSLPDAAHVRNHRTEKMREAFPSCSMRESHPDGSRAAHILSFTKMTGNSSSVSVFENLHSTLEVTRVQEALRSSVRELHAAVIDPLPEALQAAEKLCSTRVATNPDSAVENQIRAETLVAPEVGPVQQNPETNHIQAPMESIENNLEKANKKEKFIGDAQGHEIHDAGNNVVNARKKDNVIGDTQSQPCRKRSLMEPNDTGHTFERDDSIYNTSRSKRVTSPSIPSSSRPTVTSSQPYVNKNLWRRERRKWTPNEEETLSEAVKKFGKRWKFILEAYSDKFPGRTEVDLKDKWRNMLIKYST